METVMVMIVDGLEMIAVSKKILNSSNDRAIVHLSKITDKSAALCTGKK